MIKNIEEIYNLFGVSFTPLETSTEYMIVVSDPRFMPCRIRGPMDQFCTPNPKVS